MATKSKIADKTNSSQENSLFNERISTLEKTYEQVQFLCQNLDPFKSKSAEEIQLLKKYNLHLVDDPYRLTALLITLMEDTIQELETLKTSFSSNKNTSESVLKT